MYNLVQNTFYIIIYIFFKYKFPTIENIYIFLIKRGDAQIATDFTDSDKLLNIQIHSAKTWKSW